LRLSRVTRLARVEAQYPDTRWERTVGLSALLAVDRSLPRSDEPVDLEDVDTTTGMGKLLAEARAWTREPGTSAGA
jgi:hypothetical protein